MGTVKDGLTKTGNYTYNYTCPPGAGSGGMCCITDSVTLSLYCCGVFMNSETITLGEACPIYWDEDNPTTVEAGQSYLMSVQQNSPWKYPYHWLSTDENFTWKYSKTNCHENYLIVGSDASRCGDSSILSVVDACNSDCTGSVKIDAVAVEWDSDSSITSISRNSSGTVAVKEGSPAMTFVVDGTGFWFDALHTIKTIEIPGISVLLYTDDEACGTATITVTDICDSSVKGHVRCTYGHWDEANWVNGCMLPGEADTKIVTYGASIVMEKIQGKYKQTQSVVTQGGQSNKPCSDCPAGEKSSCLSWVCTDFFGNWIDCEPFCCANPAYGGCFDWHYCYYNRFLRYCEWIC